MTDKTPRLTELKDALLAKEAELEAKLAPFLDYYDRAVNDPKLLEAKSAIKALRAELIPIKNELAALSRVNAKASMKVESGHYTR